MTLNEEFLLMAKEAKEHLEKYTASVVDAKIETEYIKQAKEVFLSILGEKLMKRVTFIPKG